MPQHAIGHLLTKRAQLGLNELPQRIDKHNQKRKKDISSKASVKDCAELCSLLLQKVGADVSTTEPSAVDHLFTTVYSPRILELLSHIATTLDSDGLINAASDVTIQSDDEPDAVVPIDVSESLPTCHTLSNTEAVVPSFPHPPQKPNPSSAPFFLSPTSVPAKVNNVIQTPTPAAATYNKETEIAISRIFDLGKVSSVVDTTIPVDAPHLGPTVVSMTGFGELGRFGNQVLQYVFLKAYATRYNINEIQVPSWVGAALFGLHDRPVQRAFPPVVEFRGTLANSTFTTDFIDYVKKSNADRTVAELFPSILGESSFSNGQVHSNVDVWGWFQWHTSHFAPFKNVIRDTFEAVPELKMPMTEAFNSRVRFRGGKKHTVVGLHLRLGDYQNIAASSFGYCAPTSWYLQWLSKIWPTLENPILFVASDDIAAVLRDFAAYSPVTSDSVGLEIPEEMKGLKAGFFPDWFSLTQCDVLAISNSTFSFSACLMNQRPNARFFRAHYCGAILEIDPWNTDPIVHRDMNKAGLSSALETLQVVYNTQGSRGLMRNLMYELPYYGIRSAIMKGVLWKQAYRRRNISA